MKKSNLAPIYCGLYPDLSDLVREHGYALAVHGSLARDFDLICVPWVENPSLPNLVVERMIDKFALRAVGDPDITFHGRIRYTISISFGNCFIDLSFMPIKI